MAAPPRRSAWEGGVGGAERSRGGRGAGPGGSDVENHGPAPAVAVAVQVEVVVGDALDAVGRVAAMGAHRRLELAVEHADAADVVEDEALLLHEEDELREPLG